MFKRACSALVVVPLLFLFAAPPAAASGGYRVDRLVSDVPGRAANLDPHLVNAWGLVAGPSTPWWVADNGTDASTLYDGAGNPLPLVVKVAGAPTGTVFNGGSGFVVSHKDESGPSIFLFATEAGTIRGWDPSVGPGTTSRRSFIVVNRSHAGAIYKGLAIASIATGSLLYATDFHNGRVDVFDANLDRVRSPGAFVDPGLPSGFAPFGIQTVGESIFVTYAMQDANAEDDVKGSGLGFVDEYTATGAFVQRVVSRGDLNAPWGIAQAPEGFGEFSGDLLIGNFGDGEINAFAPTSKGGFEDQGELTRPGGRTIAVDGLWALEFGNGGAAGPTTSLFFTAGPADEAHGLFGKIEAAS
jgi:uncharacterized protein (TIGR03118 family)